jgi:sensor domain CHASE-containing protein
MNLDNIVMFNFILTVVLAFLVYRQAVVYTFRRERENDEMHQEIRNNMDYVNGRLDNLQDRIDRDMLDLYRDLQDTETKQRKKNPKGLDSRIPF